MTPILIKSFLAASAIAPYTIAAMAGSGVGSSVSTATSAAALSVGITDSLGCEAGQMVDLTQIGWSELRLGATVVAGQKLTADAQGHGVPLPTGASQVIATAMVAGVSGDVIAVLLTPSTANTPA